MRRQVIRLEPDDDIATVRNRLEWAIAPQVILTISGRNRTFQNLVNLKLLKRIASTQGVDVALVTSDSRTRVLAHEADLRVFWFTWMARHVPWWRPPRHLTRRPPAGPPPPRPTGLPRRRYPAPWWRVILAVIISAAFLVAVAGALAFVVLPQATVTLVPAVLTLDESYVVVADPELDEIDPEGRRIPARVPQSVVEAKGEVPARARRDVPEDRATGSIVFINKGDQPVVLPEGTMVNTTAGTNVRFRTVAEVSVPAGAGGRVSVGIIAVDPGPSGNVKAWSINAVEPPLDLNVNVINDEPTTGGTAKPVSIVTEEERAQLRLLVVQRLEQESRSRINDLVKEGEVLVPGTVRTEIVDEQFDPEAEEKRQMLSLTMRLRIQALTFFEADAEAMALERLRSQVQPGFQFLPETWRYERGEITLQDGQVKFNVSTSGVVVSVIDADSVRRQVRGKPLAEAEAALSETYALARPPLVVLEPEWARWVPWLTFRIDVILPEQG